MTLYKLNQMIEAGELPPMAGKIAEMLLTHDEDYPLWKTLDEFGLIYPFGNEDATAEDLKAFGEWGRLFLKVHELLGLESSARNWMKFLLAGCLDGEENGTVRDSTGQ